MSICRVHRGRAASAIRDKTEFVQAVQEVAEDIFDFIADKEEYHHYQILRRIAEPDRVISLPRLLGGR